MDWQIVSRIWMSDELALQQHCEWWREFSKSQDNSPKSCQILSNCFLVPQYISFKTISPNTFPSCILRISIPHFFLYYICCRTGRNMTFQVTLRNFMKHSHFLSHIYPGTFLPCPFMWLSPKYLERVLTKGYSISAWTHVWTCSILKATMDGKLSTWVPFASVACLPSVLAQSAWQCQCQMSLPYWECQLFISKHDLLHDIAACRSE